MKEFHRNYVYRPTDSEKKGRRPKNQPKEPCKCYAPFVKLHYYDCPVVKKSCPVHGHPHYHDRPEEKPEPEQNMIISFHPSSKTERLFQPVKTLLAQCDPETKVNLQYYSPKSTTSKESLKHQQVPPKGDDGQKPLNNSFFVEKSKSFVADKTNKMKKLKQCFHSPCNSIAHKSRSQTSIREKFHEIFHEDKRRASELGNTAPDKPPDDIRYEPNWFSSRFDLKDWEKLSGGKVDSDFITVTQQARNNLINHKIFEIRHKKGLSDLPWVMLPKQSTQLVYSSVDVERPVSKTPEFGAPEGGKRGSRKGSSAPGEELQENEGKQKGDEEASSEDNTSSSSSVYFTPFIFVPATESEGERKDEAVQVGEGGGERRRSSVGSGQELVSESQASKTRSVQQQTELDRQSGDSGSLEWYLRNVEVAESFTTRGTQTEEWLYPSERSAGKGRNVEFSSEQLGVSRNESEESEKKDKQTGTSSYVESVGVSVEVSRTVEVQTSSYRSIVSSARWAISRIDKICQTEPLKVQEVSRLWSVRLNRSNVATPKVSNKTTQTVLSQSWEDVAEVTESTRVTYMKPFGQEESEQAIDSMAKAWWGKSQSDSELYGNRKCECGRAEFMIPLQGCQCKASGAPREVEAGAKGGGRSSRVEAKAEEGGEAGRKVDKGMGTDDGAQRLYRRAEKALGTDSGLQAVPETPRRRTEATTSTETRRTRTPERQYRQEQNPPKEDSPRTPVSDLSELARIIQDFFEKMGMKNCTCDLGSVPGKKDEPERAKKEFPENSASNKKIDSETMTDVPKKPKAQFASGEVESTPKGAADTRLSSKPGSDRVKIRRSVLLDEFQSRTRFICSVCAREISTYSMNAATNTESLSGRRKDMPAAVCAEISELVKVKTVRTMESFENPNRSVVSAPDRSREVYGGADADPKGSKALRETPRSPQKSYIPTPRAGGAIERAQCPLPAKQTPTTSSQRPPAIKRCFCEDPDKVCTADNCPNREPPGTTAGFRAPPPGGPELQPRVEHPAGPNSQSRINRRSVERNRAQRRNLEHYYPVLVKPLWPRELGWNVGEKSEDSIPEKWKSPQQKRGYEKEVEPVESPAGKKIRAEVEKPSKHCFLFGDPAPSEGRVGDPRVLPNKGEFIWIPSLSASHVAPPRKPSLSPSKSIKSEEKVCEGHRTCGVSPEKFPEVEPPDLSSAKSCHLTPIAVGCGGKQPFEKLFECRVCKSLTLMKNDKDEVVFPWAHGLLAYRPGTPEEQRAGGQRPPGEEAAEALQDRSSSHNLAKLLEECSRFFDRSDSLSTEELVEEEQGEATEEEAEGVQQSNGGLPSLDDVFYSTAAVSSKSFNTVWFDGSSKK